MTRQTRNKRKKSPSPSVDAGGSVSTVQGLAPQPLENPTADVLSEESDYEVIAPEPLQFRGRRPRAIMSDMGDESYEASHNDFVANDDGDQKAATNTGSDTDKVDDESVIAETDAKLDSDGAAVVEATYASEVNVQGLVVVVPEQDKPAAGEVAAGEVAARQEEGITGIEKTSPTLKAPDARSGDVRSTDAPPTPADIPLDLEETAVRPPPSEEVVRSVDDIRNNLETGIKHLGSLEEVYTCSNTGGTTLATSLPSVDLRYEVNDMTALRRIYTLATLKGNVRLHNLGLAKPQDYYFFEKEKYIRRKAPPGVAEFFIIGTVTLSKLLGGEVDKNRQLCLRPMWELFGRSQAFIGAMLKKKGYYVSTFQSGVSFSSLFPQKPREDGRTYPSRSRYSNTVLPFTPSGVDVPIYDGTINPFTLSTYHKLERYRQELQQNSVVMVTFTVGAYTLPSEKVPADAMPGLDTRVSFNIKDVVLIAPSSVDFHEKVPSGEEPWGVERSQALWQPENQGYGGPDASVDDVVEPEI